MGYRTLEEKLDEIRRLKLDLTDKDCEPEQLAPHRPGISIWATKDGDDPAHVAVSSGALWGQPVRFLELSPSEARILANHLRNMADALADVLENHEPPDPPGFEAGFAANH